MSSNTFVTKSSVNEIVLLTKFVQTLTNPEPQYLPDFKEMAYLSKVTIVKKLNTRANFLLSSSKNYFKINVSTVLFLPFSISS